MLERDRFFGILGFITFVVFGGILRGVVVVIEAVREWFAGSSPGD